MCETLRPTDVGGADGIAYDAAEVSSFALPAAQARVTYALEGPHAPALASSREDSVPNVVVIAAEAAEDALAKYAELGFEALGSDALSSCPSHGEDELVDVYLVDFASSADGKAVPHSCELVGGARRCNGFVLVDNDFRRSGYEDAAEGFRTVVPHELFHLLQSRYAELSERWWLEGSAQWAAKLVYPELADFERHLPAFFQQTARALDAPPSGIVADYLYGSAIWPRFLEERYGALLVRRIFERLAAGGVSVLEATDAALTDHSSSLAEAYLTFAAYNAATAERAQPGVGYRDALSYPLVPSKPFGAASDAQAAGVLSGLGAIYYELDGATSRGLELQADPGRVAALFLARTGAGAELDLGGALALPVADAGAGVVVVAGQSSLKTDAPFVLRATPVASDQAAATSSSSCSLAPTRLRASGALAGWLTGFGAGLAALRRRRVGSMLRSNARWSPK